MIPNLIQSLINQDIVPEGSKRSFQPGQIFNGKIVKLFPNQIAEVQVVNQKLVAKLEVALTAETRYWFQVLPGEGKIHLKVMAPDVPTQQEPSLTGLIKGLNLPNTKETADLIKFFMKEQLPMSKETVHSALQILPNGQKSDADFAALKEIISRNLPMTKDVFSGIQSNFKHEPLHQLISDLRTKLVELPLQSKGEASHQPAQEMKPKGGEPPLTTRNEPVSQLIQDAKAKVLDLLSAGKNEPVQNHLSNNVRTELLAPAQINRHEPLLTLLNTFTLPEQDGANEATRWENSKWVADYIKGMANKIGIGYENEVTKWMGEGKQTDLQKLDVLKAALIRFISEESNLSLKESSQRLLDKITGIQLLSHDATPLQQYVLQVPLSFWNKTTDLTIQWSGRKKENGQIDSDYCRILFYLELEFLDEVVVDLQIQNRIMNIRVINDTEHIKLIAAPYMDSLKENLDVLGYKLSNITFQTTEDQSKAAANKPLNPYHQRANYNGVDIRI